MPEDSRAFSLQKFSFTVEQTQLLSQLLTRFGYATANIDTKFDESVNDLNKHRKSEYTNMASVVAQDVRVVTLPFWGRYGYLIESHDWFSNLMKEMRSFEDLSEDSLVQMNDFVISLLESIKQGDAS